MGAAVAALAGVFEFNAVIRFVLCLYDKLNHQIIFCRFFLPPSWHLTSVLLKDRSILAL